MCKQHVRCTGGLVIPSPGDGSRSRGVRCGLGVEAWGLQPQGTRVPSGSAWEEKKQDDKTPSCVQNESHPSRDRRTAAVWVGVAWPRRLLPKGTPWKLDEGERLAEGAIARFAGAKCKVNPLFYLQPQ